MDDELDPAADAIRHGRDPLTVAPSTRRVAGRVQGIAMDVGRGRVIVAGEAAMFSAQILTQPGEPDFRFGMNRRGNDDQQFVLNALRWLSRAT